ncbi:Aste57867_21166 [Aphanomyces stellatus]|uniref:Aste57867_21166 protein n=1 Tax=Aphanomyces stellatus TaxID=120398 RepID=A0A485LGT8_9STRA|nr:hypothetical protein As57867_021098 [Aphanomyces stellatus]VFT97840.1 Aste57867_21166 [Aphanomyces stellatus]
MCAAMDDKWPGTETVFLEMLVDLGACLLQTLSAFHRTASLEESNDDGDEARRRGHRLNKYVRIKDPTVHLDTLAPQLRYELSYTSNLTSAADLFDRPSLFRQLVKTAIAPAMRQVLPMALVESSTVTSFVGMDATCSICWEPWYGDDDSDGMRRTCQLPCNHRFHEDCLGSWLARHATCPLCRAAPPSIQDKYAIDQVQTYLRPRNDHRLSTGEMVVRLKPRDPSSRPVDVASSFSIQCVVDDGGRPRSCWMQLWHRLGLAFVRRRLWKHRLHWVCVACCYVGVRLWIRSPSGGKRNP